MDLEEVLRSRLKTRNDRSGSNQKIADETNISQSYINQLLNGRRSFYGLSLKNLLLLFPEIQHVLEEYYTQGGLSASVIGNGSAASVNGNATAAPVTIGAAKESSINLSELSSAILNDDNICDACKVKVLKIMQKPR